MNRGRSSDRDPSLRFQRAFGMPYVVGWILGGLSVLVGAIGILAEGGQPLRYAASYSWPVAQGVVVDASVTTSPSRRGRGQVGLIKARTNFRHDGRDWTTDHYSLLTMWTGDIEGMTSRVAELRAAPSVEVLVDPADPTRSVLVRGGLGVLAVHCLVYVFAAIGAGALGITGLSFAYKEAGRPRQGVLGLWGRLVGRKLNEAALQSAVIYALVLIPMAMLGAGIYLGDWILVGAGAYVGYGVWRACQRR